MQAGVIAGAMVRCRRRSALADAVSLPDACFRAGTFRGALQERIGAAVARDARGTLRRQVRQRIGEQSVRSIGGDLVNHVSNAQFHRIAVQPPDRKPPIDALNHTLVGFSDLQVVADNPSL